MLDARCAPTCFIRGSRFTPGYDPFLASRPRDETAVYASEKERDISAARKGAIRLTGDQFMEHQDKLREKGKQAQRERRMKAIKSIPRRELIAAVAGAMPRKKAEKISIG
jgi:predicted house-cleaning NTP pyrophosphatase (Maf/HAM1 superfamily)